IPAAELAPGMVRIQFRDREGEFWVDATHLKKSPPHQIEFGPEFLEVFEFLSETFAEVYPQTVEEWADGFRRDANPKQKSQSGRISRMLSFTSRMPRTYRLRSAKRYLR